MNALLQSVAWCVVRLGREGVVRAGCAPRRITTGPPNVADDPPTAVVCFEDRAERDLDAEFLPDELAFLAFAGLWNGWPRAFASAGSKSRTSVVLASTKDASWPPRALSAAARRVERDFRALSLITFSSAPAPMSPRLEAASNA